MVQDDLKFPPETDTLHRFERVADSAAVAEELSTLLGRAPLFSEFTRDDVKSLAEYMGVYRVTFLIGKDGKIQKIWPDVKPDGHSSEILAELD